MHRHAQLLNSILRRTLTIDYVPRVILCVMSTLDHTDARLLLALNDDPQATRVDLAQRLELSRNTVHARLARWEGKGVLGPMEHRVVPQSLDYPLTAFVTIRIDQHLLDELTIALSDIPEVIEVHGLAGMTDLMARVVARDTEDLYRIAGILLAAPGVERTNVGISMYEMVPYRVSPLLKRAAAKKPSRLSPGSA